MPGVNTRRLVAVAMALAVAIALGVTAVVVTRGTVNVDDTGAAGRSQETRSGDANASGRWVVEENAKPGTEAWRLTGPLNEGNIEGYADVTSATWGQSVKLFVSTDAPSYRVEAYRMGFYGGAQARLVWASENLPGRRQPPPVVDLETNMVEAKWQPSLTVTIDRSWPPGQYLFKLDASNDYGQYIPLAVRDDTSRAGLLVMNAVTTWQAYNTWGGHSLYEGRFRGGGYGAAGRSQVVSFDRPYKNDSGSGDFLGNELPLISFLESLGLDVAYWTNIDLHQRPKQLANHRTLVTLGHDEYWTKEMRDAVERARDSGMNVIFFGANALFRAIRLGPSPLGPARQQVNYRAASDDPLYGVDDSRVTVNWREEPLNRPESSLVGTYYDCNPVEADMVISDAAAWVFADTGLQNGDEIDDIVGPEYDRYTLDAPQPPGPVQVLAHSPLRCGGRSSYSDMTYYTTPSGAGVFATGTNWWISRLGPDCGDDPCDRRVAQVTQNVLEVFAAGPAGHAHPSRSNYSEILRESRASSTTTVNTRPSTTTTTVEELPTVPPGPPPLPFPTTPFPANPFPSAPVPPTTRLGVQ